MAAIPMIVMIAGTIMSAVSQMQKGKAEKQMAEANAELADQEGKMRQQAYKEEAYKLSKERQRTIGTQQTIFGASGVDVGSGSALDVISNTAAEYERDIGFAGLHGDQARKRGQFESDIYRFKGEQAETAGWLGAGTTLLGGFGKMWGGMN